MALNNEKSTSHFHVVGCVYLVQLWCFDHLLICNSKFNIGITKFSCLLHWMNVKVGDNVIRSVFDKDVGVFYVCVSNEELGHCVVKEGFEKFRTGYKKERIKEKEHL
ncbi:hypothetical protein DEO72_LG10g1499 [Vigna unguiculata]|uniref:Uncharacterized protein n=1 Tax=Vigna unguiculata TaxID=3917 RepID=A0A4D6NBM6_VIGUN|nr:hypothetical protein DEO72_LG10g1499 [Vigna unguiculata]